MFPTSDKEIVDSIINNFSPILGAVVNGTSPIGSNSDYDNKLFKSVTGLLRSYYKENIVRMKRDSSYIATTALTPHKNSSFLNNLKSEPLIVQHIYKVLSDDIKFFKTLNIFNLHKYTDLAIKLKAWNPYSKMIHGCPGKKYYQNPLLTKNLNEILFHEEPGVEAFYKRRLAVGEKNRKKNYVRKNVRTLVLNSLTNNVFEGLKDNNKEFDFKVEHDTIGIDLYNLESLSDNGYAMTRSNVLIEVKINESKPMFKIVDYYFPRMDNIKDGLTKDQKYYSLLEATKLIIENINKLVKEY